MPKTKTDDKTPRAVRPFVELGFVKNDIAGEGDEWFGDCPLCGKRNKFYVNTSTGQFSCKSGVCNREGNIYTFLREWFDLRSSEDEGDWESLVEDRGIPEEFFRDAGLVWDDDANRWAIPVYNPKGSIVSARFWRFGGKSIAIKGLDLGIFGIEYLIDESRADEPVYVCEGEWDALALRWFLKENNIEGIVIAVPGNNVFKEQWAEFFNGRDVILCYDGDAAGIAGRRRAFGILNGVARSLKMILWPSELPPKYDVRDFVTQDAGTADAFTALIVPYIDPEAKSDGSKAPTGAKTAEGFEPLAKGTRITLAEVRKRYGKWIKLTPDLWDCLRVTYAVVITTQIGGDPLWIHLAGPPGSGKTVIIQSVGEVGNVIHRSSLTANSLVSGYVMPGGKDPSLIPHLMGKCFTLKDFTEVLGMAHNDKERIYGVLRGAYDGVVEWQFGGPAGLRRYEGYFNMVSGVTHKIFGESHTVLGERFLILHLSQESARDTDDVIREALKNSRGESRMKSELAETAKDFLEYQITEEDIPEIDEEYTERVVALAQLVARLRATVDKERFAGETRVKYRPEPEVGTRVAKQLQKLLLGLALQNNPPEVTEEDYRIVQRVAIDSCIGWNMDTINWLMQVDGQSMDEIAAMADIPKTTLKDQLEELVMLGVIYKDYIPNPNGRGGPGNRISVYRVTHDVKEYWEKARMKPRSGKGNQRIKTRIDDNEMGPKTLPEHGGRMFFKPNARKRLQRNGGSPTRLERKS